MTDVTVNHLNSRLALQLPSELPLGLVFVVGQVEHLHQTSGAQSNIRTKFQLVEQEHRISCELSERATAESLLLEGSRIRAGGHLAFDSHRARYFLLARDIEMVSLSPTKVSEPEVEPNSNGIHKVLGRQALTPILADIKRRAENSHLEEAPLPYWVRRLAPPEVQEEFRQLEPIQEVTAVGPSPPTLDLKMMSVLSQAMDSDEEIELTPKMLAKLAPTATTPSPLPMDPYQAPSISHPLLVSQAYKTNLIAILVFAFFLLTILLIILFA